MSIVSIFKFSTDIITKTPFVSHDMQWGRIEAAGGVVCQIEKAAQAKGLTPTSTAEECEALLTEYPHWQTDRAIRSSLFKHALVELPLHFVAKLLETDPTLAHRRILCTASPPLKWIVDSIPEKFGADSAERRKSDARSLSLSRLLLSRGAEINSTFTGRTTLLETALKEKVPLAKFLIMHGAKIYHKHLYGGGFSAEEGVAFVAESRALVLKTVRLALEELRNAKFFVEGKIYRCFSKRSYLFDLTPQIRLNIWSYLEPEVVHNNVKRLM